MPLAKARAMLRQCRGWTLNTKRPNSIEQVFTFKDFVKAMAFINKVARLAELEGHHPDIHCSWNQVRLVLWTHAVKGLSQNDFIMAARINRLS